MLQWWLLSIMKSIYTTVRLIIFGGVGRKKDPHRFFIYLFRATRSMMFMPSSFPLLLYASPPSNLWSSSSLLFWGFHYTASFFVLFFLRSVVNQLHFSLLNHNSFDSFWVLIRRSFEIIFIHQRLSFIFYTRYKVAPFQTPIYKSLAISSYWPK